MINGKYLPVVGCLDNDVCMSVCPSDEILLKQAIQRKRRLLPSEVSPLNPARGCELPSGFWGGAPAEVEFGVFYL